MNLKYYLLFITCLTSEYVNAINLSRPRVYVVTPATKVQVDEGRSAPFYYHNWMRRMDPPKNMSTTTTPKQDTHDLIFAEFESNNGDKSIRKLLEKEKLDITTKMKNTYDSAPNKNIYKEDTPENIEDDDFKYTENQDQIKPNKLPEYMSMYNNVYVPSPAPVYLPSTTAPPTTTYKSSTIITTTKTSDAMDVKNIWHIIDDEKYNQYAGKWEEQAIVPQDPIKSEETNKDISSHQNEEKENFNIYNNFALPGFTTNAGSRGENESRAIRTEPNMQFPYVKLKTMQIKNPFINNKKGINGNNLYTNIDNFQDVKYPVRGEAQDVVPNQTQIDRYNSAQPYFSLGQKNSKQSYSKPVISPPKTVGSLVPPPPPSKPINNYLPPPSTYESFPPYPPSAPPSPPKQVPPIFNPPSVIDDSDSPPMDSVDSDGPPTGYQYNPPSSKFMPTVAPPMSSLNKPFKGYTYEKPSAPKPAVNPPTYSYNFDHDNDDHDHDTHDDHDDHDAHDDHDTHDHPPDDHPDPPHDTPDYPELVFDKHKGGSDDSKSPPDDSQDDTMDMAPPPPPQAKPMDSGFPHDFPGDFKYHDDFDDFYHDHHHHYHPTEPPSTTEMPRVNRYSYYYLGKKLYYIPLYFSAYFVAYVASLVIKSILRHKIVYPNSYKPNEHSATFFSKRSVDSSNWNFSDEKLHEVTRVVTDALYNAAEKYMNNEK